MTPVVLDTCVVLWLASQQDKLSANARGVLADPAVALHVSAISAWEIAIKSRKGKLALPSAPEAWWQTFLNSFGVNEVAVTGSIAMRAVAEVLPLGDPADRIRAPGAQGSKVANNTEPSRRSSRCLRSSSAYSAWSPWRSSPRNAVSSVPSGFTRTAPTNGLAREYDPFVLLGQFSFASPEFYVSHGGSPHTG